MSSAVSSSMDEEDESGFRHSKNHSASSTSTDVHESDQEMEKNNKQIMKTRRLQKNRKASFSTINKKNGSTPSKTNIRKTEQQKQSSSNDDNDHNNEKNSTKDELASNNRRIKPTSLKRRNHLTTTAAIDDEATKYHCYHPLDIREQNGQKHPSDSTCLSSMPTVLAQANPVPARKENRFQIKSIRKSQQQQILLANAAMARASNDDDSPLFNQEAKVPLKSSLIEHKHANTPINDAENSTINVDGNVENAISTLKTDENNSNGHHCVRFLVIQHKKNESAAEEEKSPIQMNVLPAPVPPSSAISVQGEVS